MRSRTRWVLGGIAAGLGVLAWAVLARALAPRGNTAETRFDAIVILGAHVDSDGNPSPTLLSRVTEGVREYERGVAPRIVVTGGDENGHSQARVMAHIAEAQGVPAQAILLEPDAENTIENACFSVRLMKQHGWNSAEVVTSPSHVPRARVIFSRLPIEWRVHAAPPITERRAGGVGSVIEDLHMVYYLLYSRWADRCSL